MNVLHSCTPWCAATLSPCHTVGNGEGMSRHDPSAPAGGNRCTKRKTNGEPCTQYAVHGTDACPNHAGISKQLHRAKGQVVVELHKWGLTDQVRDPGEVLLKLVSQSASRVEFYSGLLQDAYEAAERLRDNLDATVDQVPGQKANATDLERAAEDLDRIFTTGGVAALVGYKYGTAGQDGNLYVVEEALRGLVQLEAMERDRCATMATKAIAAGLAERQVRLAEQQGALVAQVIQASLGALLQRLTEAGLPDNLRSMWGPLTREIVPAQLRALEE